MCVCVHVPLEFCAYFCMFSLDVLDDDEDQGGQSYSELSFKL